MNKIVLFLSGKTYTILKRIGRIRYGSAHGYDTENEKSGSN